MVNFSQKINCCRAGAFKVAIGDSAIRYCHAVELIFSIQNREKFASRDFIDLQFNHLGTRYYAGISNIPAIKANNQI